jgi:hypothetical protein
MDAPCGRVQRSLRILSADHYDSGSFRKNRLYWKRFEAAERRLLYPLWELRLQPAPKLNDAEAGLAFEFLQDLP